MRPAGPPHFIVTGPRSHQMSTESPDAQPKLPSVALAASLFRRHHIQGGGMPLLWYSPCTKYLGLSFHIKILQALD